MKEEMEKTNGLFKTKKQLASRVALIFVILGIIGSIGAATVVHTWAVYGFYISIDIVIALFDAVISAVLVPVFIVWAKKESELIE